ncbi:MAG: phage shock protein [Pseudomonadota bacterium]|jgi:phage shock protein B
MNGGFLIAIVALLIPITAIVMSHMTRWRAMRAQGLSSQVEQDLLARAEKLDERVRQLETILDAESPGWRSRRP